MKLLPRAGILLAMIVSSSCMQQSKTVHFTEEWPSESLAYDSTTEAWTRRGLLRASFSEQGSQLLEVYATFKSTQWRAAYVRRLSELKKLNHSSRQALEHDQRQQASKSHVVELLVSTYHPEHNDLHRDHSMWQVALIDADGNELLPQSVTRDRRARQLIAAEFENFGDFAEAYQVTFPYSPALMNGKKFALRMGSSLGSVELEWQAE